MEDMFYAGGLPVVMKELGSLLHLNAVTVTGKTLGENIAAAACFNREVIKALDQPLQREGGTAILKGNLAPQGAVIKQSAASPESAVGGPLAVVKDRDVIELDVPARRLELLIPGAEMKRRLAAWQPPAPHYQRGYGKMYLDHILQAHEGCDFDYLRGATVVA